MKHTKWPSALAYDEMNIHIKGWVIMKSKCAKVNEETNVYEHSNESIEVKTYLVLMMRGEII